jgi:hypothetical protein
LKRIAEALMFANRKDFKEVENFLHQVSKAIEEFLEKRKNTA